MKKIVNTFLIIIFLFIIAGCIIPTFLPKNIEFETSRQFNNPVSEVFLEFNNLENYGSWAPLISTDSLNTNINYMFPYKGMGSSFTWVNKKNNEIGKGEYKILKSKINTYIQSQIIFDHIGVIYLQDIHFKYENNSTQVKLHLKSENFSYFNRILAYFYLNHLKDDWEEGLNKLSSKLSKNNLNTHVGVGDTEFADFPGLQLLSIKNETTTDPDEIFNAAHKSLKEISKYLIDSLRYIPTDIKNPVLYYSKFDTLNHSAIFYSGYPIKLDVLPKNNTMSLISIPGGKSIYTPIEGSFNSILKFRYSLDKYSKENGIQIKPQYWEQYIDFPISSHDVIKGNAYYLITE